MFRGTLPGMDHVFHTDPPAGSIITFVGGAGTLKSAFAYAVLSARLNSHPDESAIYVTLEETKEGHLNNLKSLGLALSPIGRSCRRRRYWWSNPARRNLHFPRPSSSACRHHAYRSLMPYL